MTWPWRRFEKFYEAFQKRVLIETLERRKESMIAALWSNSNWDDDKGSRTQAVEELEQNFTNARDMVLTGVKSDEVEIDENDPFFKPALEGLAQIEEPRNDEGTVGEVVSEKADDFAKYIDQ